MSNHSLLQGIFSNWGTEPRSPTGSGGFFAVWVTREAHACMGFTPKSYGNYSRIMAVFLGSAMRWEDIARILLRLLCQPEENIVIRLLCQPGERLCAINVLCYVCFYDCCASWKRINVSEVPMGHPKVSFPPLSLLLAYSWVQRTMLTVSRAKTIGVRNRKKSNTKGLATSHIHRSCPNLKGGYYTELHTTGRSLGNHLKILPATLFTGYREGERGL